jgi:hypothetical protein
MLPFYLFTGFIIGLFVSVLDILQCYVLSKQWMQLL